LSLSPPKEVLTIAETLRRAGHQAWCVGGAVRDALLGHDHLDWDLATSATPPEVQRLFKRTVPVGTEFGTVGVLDPRGTLHEVTTFRKDVHTDGRHAVVEFGASLDDDLARRDFTINAIAYDPATGELRDPFDGQTDLKRGLVRAVGVADERMREDRLRALRAIRFAARFHFHIEPATWAAIKASAPHLGRLSPERVKQELEKTMQQVERPSVALEWWREAGALAMLVPAIAEAPRERFLALDLLPRVAADGDDPKGPTAARLAMLFFGDAPEAVEAAARALRFSNADVAWFIALARARHAVGHAVDAVLVQRDATPVELRRWVAAVGRTRADAFCRLMGALAAARSATPHDEHGAPQPDANVVDRYERFRAEAVAVAFRDPVEIADLAIDGEDLRKAGVQPGPAMGRVLKALLDMVIEDPALNTPGVLMKIAAGLATEG
jgi:tRNA nucleotidyltransferase (CCA-adding enzyme)